MELLDDLRWRGRCYTHKALKDKALVDIKSIAYSLLPNGAKYEVEKAKSDKYYYFDGYEQNGKILHDRFRYKYRAILEARGERYAGFYANSELGIYCRLIEKLLGDESPYFPSV